MRTALAFLIILLAASGCRTSRPKPGGPVVAAPAVPATPQPPPPSTSQETPAAPLPARVQAPKAVPAPAQGNVLVGKLLERLDAAPYCYLRLQTDKGEVWAAVPDAKLETGGTVTVDNPVLMTSFESKTLKRTFPEIYFGESAHTGTAAAPDPHGDPHGDPHKSSHGKPATAPITVGRVEKATAPDARTVAEVWAKKDSLQGRTVTVRGKVVKATSGILGKTWLHLQDGSGDPNKETHDLTFTTQESAAVGDVVTAKGTVQLDKDFGSGYFYKVIVEDATLARK